ncbi:hypothetical protein ACQR1Q_08870 [Bradyrhizobium oligotrophicum]|uniref:hypothetical protein n=1 Tax=Bradyrhizobium oligotrophicum TaxID=44255 RepID=UPI003EBBEF06
MVRAKVTDRKQTLDDADAFGVAEFCRRNRISPQLFYKNRTEMPTTFRVGSRVLISRESAERWRREREAAGTATLRHVHAL